MSSERLDEDEASGVAISAKASPKESRVPVCRMSEVTVFLRRFRRYRLRAMIIGTVTTNDNVERSSADADSASMALYLAASRTTIVARGKLQQTSASRANGLCT